jgi:hypothetical protein
MLVWSIFFVVFAALANTQIVSTQTKFTRTKTNFFDPVLSANVYIGHVKETERTVQLQPRLYASDADPSNTLNGKICGYDLSLHKHDDILDDITQNIPFTVEIINNQPILKLKSNIDKLDCEIKQTHRLFIRAYDCAPIDKRRYSERSSLIITVDDVNEYAPVFTHNNYLFKLHQDETCDASSCHVEATDDDCANQDHRVCGYEITTPDAPFTIDGSGVISITKPLNNGQYDFEVIAIDCYPADDNSRKVSQPARVTVKIIKSCKPMITDKSQSKLIVQSDQTRIFDTITVNTCGETCNVEDIVGTVELNTKGLDSGCNLQQCSTIDREYVLLAKDGNSNTAPQSKIMSFNGYNQAVIVNQSDFSGHFNTEFIIRMWMKHTHDDKNNNNDKEHIFCKTDEKLKNRHHTSLFIQDNYIKLAIRKGPLMTNEKTMYTSEWMWRVSQINDNQWHSYQFDVHYPDKIDLYIDGQLIVLTDDNFRVVKEYPLTVIQGTEDTIFALGACWHARASRLAQHFHGELSGLTIQQKEELQRSSNCIRDCHQFLDLPDVQSETGVEFGSNVNRSIWILRTDTSDSYENLLKHLVYRNTFEPIGPYGQRTISIRTRVKCLGEANTYELPTFTRDITIEQEKLPVKIELKGDTNYLVPEKVINRGIYLFLNLSIYTNAIKKNQGDINDCTLSAEPSLSDSEQLIIPDVNNNLETDPSKEGLLISGVDSIDTYQSILRQIAYISRSPVTYVDRSFTLSCAGVYDQVFTNEIRVRVRVEKQRAAPVPAAAILSDKLVVDNDEMRDNIFDLDREKSPVKRNLSDWPVAVIVCVSVGLAGVLVLYLIVRIRSNNRQHNPTTNTGDDIHSQMEWEDDIGLNITVNPLDETKKSVQSVNIHNVENPMNEYPGSSSDDDGDEYENDGRNNNNNEYSSGEDNYENDQIPRKKLDHQLEWDDAAIEYGPKKV